MLFEFIMNLSSECQGFYNLEYIILLTIAFSIIQIYLACKSMISILRIALQSKINGLKTPQIFHGYGIIWCTISSSHFLIIPPVWFAF